MAIPSYDSIGVIRVLEKEGIPIDMIAGTSMGAIIGGVYAKTSTAQGMRPVAIAFGFRKIRYFSDFTIPRTGIIKGKRIEDELKMVRIRCGTVVRTHTWSSAIGTAIGITVCHFAQATTADRNTCKELSCLYPGQYYQ